MSGVESSVRIGDILLVKIGSIGYSAIVHSLNGYDHAIIPANLVKVTPDHSKMARVIFITGFYLLIQSGTLLNQRLKRPSQP